MATKMYNILGKAYADTLTKATGKSLSQISIEMGYASSFIKNVSASGRIRTGIADLIEAKYGISVAPYIVPDEYIVRKDDPEPKQTKIDYTELTVVIAQAVVNTIQSTIEEYLKEKGATEA